MHARNERPGGGGNIIHGAVANIIIIIKVDREMVGRWSVIIKIIIIVHCIFVCACLIWTPENPPESVGKNKGIYRDTVKRVRRASGQI